MKSQWMWFSGFSVFFILAMAYVFWGTWSPDVTFIQPDCGITYGTDFFIRRWTEFCSGGSFVPWELRHLLGGPYVWQELQYAVAMYLAALGVVYYLRGRGLPYLACYGAGAAYGLMGYNFTLYSAGHYGWFELLMCAPFCFGLIDRCVRKGRWQNWVLLGGLLAWGGVHQPDIWLLFTLFAFAYGVFRLFDAILCEKGSVCKRRIALRVMLGVLVAAVVMVAAGWPQLHNAIFVQTANRDKQILESTQNAHNPNGSESSAVDREKRYVFCTNWSLPPDEMLEFMIPNINGASSDMRVTPRDQYRGRIGMQVAPGRWTPYRQHSLYMGFLTVCFAIFGVFGILRRKPVDGDDVKSTPLNNRVEIIFWAVSAVVLLLVSFGGFTSFYKMVFALPMGDYIRCPVKFVHLVEWCVAVLAGFGVARIISMRFVQNARVLMLVVIGGLLFVNVLHLAVEAGKFCAVDPADTIRIAIAKETKSTSLGFVMDANSRLGDEEYLFAGGMAFRDNNALKGALAKGECTPVSFWNLQSGRLVKTARDRAAFALLKTSRSSEKLPEGPTFPDVAGSISLLASCFVCLVGFLKLFRP